IPAGSSGQRGKFTSCGALVVMRSLLAVWLFDTLVRRGCRVDHGQCRIPVRNLIDFFKGPTQDLKRHLTVSRIIAADSLSCLPESQALFVREIGDRAELKADLPIRGPLEVSEHVVLWSEKPQGVTDFDDGKLNKLREMEA